MALFDDLAAEFPLLLLAFRPFAYPPAMRLRGDDLVFWYEGTALHVAVDQLLHSPIDGQRLLWNRPGLTPIRISGRHVHQNGVFGALSG